MKIYNIALHDCFLKLKCGSKIFVRVIYKIMSLVQQVDYNLIMFGGQLAVNQLHFILRLSAYHMAAITYWRAIGSYHIYHIME